MGNQFYYHIGRTNIEVKRGKERKREMEQMLAITRQMEEKYFNLVWYARSKPSSVTNEPRKDVETKYPVEVKKLQADDGNWTHGFNSGMLAGMRLVLGIMEERDGNDVDEEQRMTKARCALSDFPMLDS